MLKTDVIWPDHRQFKSKTEWEPVGFFSECLCNAITFDLMLGFFSSSAIQVLSDGFALFLYNGGRMRLIINDILSEEDADFIAKGQNKSVLDFFDLENLKAIKETLSLRNQHFFNCLSWLMQNKRLEIKIIRPKDGLGISHTKMGVFGDGFNYISFDGSCNFSKTALIANIESITASCDWDGYVEKAKVEHTKEVFQNSFDGKDQSVTYLDISSIKENLTNTFGSPELKFLLEEESKIIVEGKRKSGISKNIIYALNRAKERLEKVVQDIHDLGDDYLTKEVLKEKIPCFPFESGPRDYQKRAFENWKANNQKGLFVMATGTGKTITALNCLLEIYNRLGYYKAIILVPTVTLVNQWESECRRFSFERIIKICSKDPIWRDQIDHLKFSNKYTYDKESQVNYIIISTYASFSKVGTFSILNSFEPTRTLLIADEAHNVGAPSLLKKLKDIVYLRRIGLSATPDRQYEEDVNKRLYSFFGVDNEFTYEYSMKEAIDNGVLCRYYYYPHLVKLTEVEMDEYVDLSIQISKYFNLDKNYFDRKDELLKHLLLERKRIIHKAENKLVAFKQIIKDRYDEKGNLKYTLIYVPEGIKPDYIEDSDIFDKVEEVANDDDSDHLIDIYTKEVSILDKYITVKKFVAGENDRDKILSDFAQGKIQVLTSMKCLDEGVDVPRSEMAIFCSSTGNPRQFIQRRGRILRTHKDKHVAILHDLVVLPEVSSLCDSFKMEQSLLKMELLRVKNFSMLSENPSYSINELKEVMEHYGLNLYNNDHIL